MAAVSPNALITVDFHGDAIFAVERFDGVYVALKPVCEALGIDPKSQRAKVQRDPVLSEGGVMVTLPTPGGPQEVLGLRLDLLNGWLFGIDSSRVRDEVREKVILYQRECYRVLYDHFHRPPPPLAPQPLASIGENLTVIERKQLVSEARLSFGPQAGRQLWKALGLPLTPAMVVQQEAPQARQRLLQALGTSPVAAAMSDYVEYLMGEGYGQDVAQATVISLEKDGLFRRTRLSDGEYLIFPSGDIRH